MSKYIDAERLKSKIERLKGQLIRGACASQIEMETNCKDEAYNEVLALIDSLQQEQPELPKIGTAEDYYHKGVCDGFSKGSADALKILDEFMKRKADPVIVIKQQEQPEVDLEKEIDTFFEGWTDCLDYSQALNAEGECVSTDEIIDIARHFYELGKLNARKED